ncbi:MAG: adenine phosphoribosyltransferase [Elusimicrobia bacterium]|nr:adenine phosphoribosyltransferase [Candidatus Liberimonas magnetica]
MQKKILDLKNSIRDIPDFPKKGILFKDITTLLNQGKLFHYVIDQFASYYQTKGIQKVVAIESRGFIFGATLAYKLKAGFVPVRKKGKLPFKTLASTYQLEYGTDTLEMHEDALMPDEKVLIIDDLLATGGTISATIDLVKKLSGKIVGLAFLIELSFLKGRDKLKDYDILTLIQY